MTQSVKDALADAETLRLWADGRWSQPHVRFVGRGARTAYRIDEAGDIGRYLRAGNDDPLMASMVARASAEAAFRAVPDLRCCA